jgi:hypothetical protein
MSYILLLYSISVTFTVNLFFFDIDIQLSHQESFGRLECLVFHFLRLLQAGYHISH